MRKVFLDKLPRYTEGIHKDKINWMASINYNVKFIYEDIKGEVEIINCYKKGIYSYINIKYKTRTLSLYVGSFQKCAIGKLFPEQLDKLLKTLKTQYKYNIGDMVKTRTGEIIILEQIKMSSGKYNTKGYIYKCLKDGNIDKISESNLVNNGRGCNVCFGKKVLQGVNDIATTNPEMIKYFVFIEDAYKYSYFSNKRIDMNCPYCGYEKSYKISNVASYGFSCPRCGDGISYPNKFACNLLIQLNIEFVAEYSPDWIKPRKYDFYFELNDKKYIVEMDGGLGHGKKLCFKNSIGAEESLEIDNYKDKMAIEHNIDVIRINCDESDLNYIKNNIFKSELLNIFDLSKINWLECHRYACDSLVKKVCDYWNSGIKNTNEISKLIKIHRNTVIDYLKKGTKLGWSDYNPKEIMIETGSINGKANAKPIVQLSLSGEYIAKFEGASEASRQLKNISRGSISNCCNNRSKSAGNYRWVLYKDYYKEILNKELNISHTSQALLEKSNNAFLVKEITERRSMN